MSYEPAIYIMLECHLHFHTIKSHISTEIEHMQSLHPAIMSQVWLHIVIQFEAKSSWKLN